MRLSGSSNSYVWVDRSRIFVGPGKKRTHGVADQPTLAQYCVQILSSAKTKPPLPIRVSSNVASNQVWRPDIYHDLTTRLSPQINDRPAKLGFGLRADWFSLHAECVKALHTVSPNPDRQGNYKCKQVLELQNDRFQSEPAALGLGCPQPVLFGNGKEDWEPLLIRIPASVHWPLLTPDLPKRKVTMSSFA